MMTDARDRRAGVWRLLFAGPFAFGVAAFPLTVVGQARRAAALRRRLLDARPPTVDDETPRARGTAVRTLVTLPLTLVAFVLSLLVAYLVWAGLLYPLRPDTFSALSAPFSPRFGPGTWGGPTLIGAWFIHAMAALGMQVVACTVIRGIGLLCRVLDIR